MIYLFVLMVYSEMCLRESEAICSLSYSYRSVYIGFFNSWLREQKQYTQYAWAFALKIGPLPLLYLISICFGTYVMLQNTPFDMLGTFWSKFSLEIPKFTVNGFLNSLVSTNCIFVHG